MKQEIKIFKTLEVLRNLKNCIKNKTPFSLVRFGDGGLKMIQATINDEKHQLYKISEKEGIPIDFFTKVLEFWKTSANISDYIDSSEVYFTDKFWKRTKKVRMNSMSKETLLKLKNWKDIYNEIGITNSNYCNPEINFLMCLTEFGKNSLPDLIKDKKICCITCRDDVNKKIKDYNIEVVKIVGKYEDQYNYSFAQVLNKINEDAKKYDLWLVAAGELGRVYPGLIKFFGGRALDIGSVIDFWCTGEIPSRLKPYVQTTIQNSLKISLTEIGRSYSDYL